MTSFSTPSGAYLDMHPSPETPALQACANALRSTDQNSRWVLQGILPRVWGLGLTYTYVCYQTHTHDHVTPHTSNPTFLMAADLAAEPEQLRQLKAVNISGHLWPQDINPVNNTSLQNNQQVPFFLLANLPSHLHLQ